MAQDEIVMSKASSSFDNCSQRELTIMPQYTAILHFLNDKEMKLLEEFLIHRGQLS